MKIKTHLRVGYDRQRRQAKVATSTKPNPHPLVIGSGRTERSLPTIAFAIVLDVPEALFARAEQVVAELTVPEEAVRIAAEVHQDG